MDSWHSSAITTGVRPNGAGSDCHDAPALRAMSVGGGAR
jgi:hypothetical protein